MISSLLNIKFKGIKPDKKLDSTGKSYEDYWPAAKRVSHLKDQILKTHTQKVD